MVRSPVVAGQFYESDPDLLRDQIKSCFLHELGPGLPAGKAHDVRATISPHAGYAFSGPCACHCYRLVAESPVPEFYLLI
ncbi:MAG: AmmeMemoRadiSam system protein B, partial [Candidatus Woesearchaeota archaeon]